MRATSTLLIGACAAVGACGGSVTDDSSAAPPSASATTTFAEPSSTTTSTSTTTSMPSVTDPPSTVVTPGGLSCAGRWYDGSATFEPGATGNATIDDAVDEWWRSEGDGLGWDRSDLQPTVDTDGRTTRYATATDRPVLLLIAVEVSNGGWSIGAWEGCSEP